MTTSKWKTRELGRDRVPTYGPSLLILAAGICLGPACCGSCDDEPAPFPRQVLLAPRLTAPIAIDGDAGDWPKTASQAKMALDPEADEYRGAARVAWDAWFLYVVFDS